MIWTIRMGTRGRVTLPKKIRDDLAVSHEMKIEWTVEGDGAVGRIVTTRDGKR